MNNNKKCPVCTSEGTKEVFEAVVRQKYTARYRFCEQCKFLFVESPEWMDEAYKEPINISDTGLVARNLTLSRVTSVILYLFFDKEGKFLDYAGGYGIFTRLMRDIGFDFYWHDPYSPNLVARGFELVDSMSGFELLTCFEVLEHLREPMKEIEKMSRLSDSILFTTTLLSADIPKPNDWYYYGLDHGQHISFYSFETIQFIAKTLGYNLCSNRTNIHMLTKRTVNPVYFNLFLKLSHCGFFNYVKRRMRSKTEDDRDLNASRRSCRSKNN
jgi:hypothetical protein